MADWTSIARPYAKAIFLHALADKALPEWSAWLATLESVVLRPEMLTFIHNPETTVASHEAVMLDVMESLAAAKKSKAKSALQDVQKALISVLAENKRLTVLPQIVEQFEALRADEEQRILVQVESFSPLTKTQEKNLIARLTKRLNRTVTLEVSINPSLLGGAVISAKDWVINASVKGQLDKLGADLMASSRG